MKTKTSYYVCPNYFIHKKEHSLILCSFYSHLTETISQKYRSYVNRDPSKLTYAPYDYQFKERGQHFLSDFSAKNSLYTTFSLIERRFP